MQTLKSCQSRNKVQFYFHKLDSTNVFGEKGLRKTAGKSAIIELFVKIRNYHCLFGTPAVTGRVL